MNPQQKRTRELMRLTGDMLIATKYARGANLDTLLEGKYVRKVDVNSKYETARRAATVASLLSPSSRVLITFVDRSLVNPKNGQLILGDVFYIQDKTAYFFLPRSYWKKGDGIGTGLPVQAVASIPDHIPMEHRREIRNSIFDTPGKYAPILNRLEMSQSRFQELVNISLEYPEFIEPGIRRVLHDYAILTDPMIPRRFCRNIYATANGVSLNNRLAGAKHRASFKKWAKENIERPKQLEAKLS